MNETPRHISSQTRIEQLEAELEKEKSLRYEAENNERCFRELAEQIGEVFWMTNPLGDALVYISPAYEHIWGQTCQSLHDDPGRRLAWVHDDDREAVLIAFKRDAAHGNYDETFRIKRPDGETRWIRDRAFPVHDDNGELYRLAGFALDITQNIETSDHVSNLHAAISERDRLSVFAALGTGLAHDLSQPLTAVRNFIAQARMQLENSQNAPPRAALDQADGEIERAANIVRHLRDFAREGRPTRARTPLHGLIDDARQLMDPALRAHDIRYTGPTRKQLEGIAIPLDRIFIQQILRNLIANAVDAVDEEQAARRLDIGVSWDERHVDIEIADNGTGIGDDVDLFQPFATSKESGLGLGLAVSRMLARSHDGDLLLVDRGRRKHARDHHDDENRRTRLVLRLPRTEEIRKYLQHNDCYS